MGSNVSTTITFTTQTLGSGSSIAIELDPVKNGNKGQFASGDTVFFRVYTSPLSMPLDKASSSGIVSIDASATGDITETLTFANSKEATLRYLGNSLKSFRWFGANLGTPVLKGNVITLPEAGIGVLEVVYDATYREANLSGVTIPVGIKDFPVVVVISEQAAS